MYTLQDDIQTFKAAVALEKLTSRSTLHRIRLGGLVMFFGGGITAALLYVFPDLSPTYSMYRNIAAGVGVMGIAAWLDSFLATAYHNSYYFRGMRSVLGLTDEPATGATYDVASVALTQPDDLGRAFTDSTIGKSILSRIGIEDKHIQTYQTAQRNIITSAMVTLPEAEIFSVIGLVQFLLAHDSQFKHMLTSIGIEEQTCLDATRWIVGNQHQAKRAARWWSRDNLSKHGGLGRELAFGRAYLLEKFSRDVRTSAVFSTLTRDSAYASEKIAEIEYTLNRSKAANTLVIGESGVGKTDLVIEVVRRMRNGESSSSLQNEHVVVLDTSRLFAVSSNKQSLEETLLEMFDEAAAAGKIIIVIENLSTVIKEAAALGVHLPELLDVYLAHPDIHIIGTDTPQAFHTHLQTLGSFTRRFTHIQIETPGHQATTRVLLNIALTQEHKHSLYFTYQAIDTIALAADRHIVEGVMPDKAITLLLEIVQSARQNKQDYITSDLVSTYVSTKTGIPTGPIQADERDRLLHLEDSLHQLVIGQEQAISAVANTLRRARAGIQAIDKPIGSFLFFGPTGVGKTETAKALATIFFGGEHNLQRLDMSEFSGDQALQQLIGTTDAPGALSSLLREHPYSVVLLDEFEKASQAVHDVFLQILDEGFFTDGRGQQVNARNTIMIATSNAGSQLILDTVHSRQTLTELNEEIINHIIDNGLFRPELINRFDSAVIFEPLTIRQQGQVAQLMLKGLYDRIAHQGYHLIIDESLLSILVEKGYHPEFGARPMQRVLQDVIEAKVAEKIIAGDVKKGETITLTTRDFTEAELQV